MKLILSISSVAVFWSRFWVCKLAYPEAFKTHPNYSLAAADKFADLSYSFYAVLAILCFLNSFHDRKMSEVKASFNKFVLSFGIGLCVSDIVDRFVFNIKEFTREDIVMIILNILICYINTYHKEVADRLVTRTKVFLFKLLPLKFNRHA